MRLKDDNINMGHIILDPKTLLNKIYQGYWIKTTLDPRHDIPEYKCYIYDGTSMGMENEIEPAVVKWLILLDFIILDSANDDFGESYYHLNIDFDLTDKSRLQELIQQITDENKSYKNKYKHLLREIKLKRILEQDN